MKILKGLLYIACIILVVMLTMNVVIGEPPLDYIKEFLKIFIFN